MFCNLVLRKLQHTKDMSPNDIDDYNSLWETSWLVIAFTVSPENAIAQLQSQLIDHILKHAANNFLS